MTPDAEVALEMVEGDLREIDLDNRTFTLRNLKDRTGAPQVCAYDQDHDETAFEAVDRRVEVVGRRVSTTGRRGGKLQVLRLVILDRAGDEG